MFCITQSQLGENVLHYEGLSFVGTGGTIADAAARISTVLAPLYKPLLHPAATFYGVMCRQVFPLPKSISYADATGAGSGTGTGGALPKQVSYLISKKSETPGRKGQGRLYVPFPAGGDNDTATAAPNAGAMVKLIALRAQLVSTLTIGAGGNTSVISPILWNQTEVRIVPITAMFAVQEWATQRRRGDFGRKNALPF